ncbi:DNA repair protein RecN [Thiohalorhabdus methylotrophus]|uniref:DNA repair protein RecN n=1 Tax=Thiohalorhabdus methylotrophus TaxID=3242694 RepID=A0ABV4U011_9GAMM
MLQHLSIRNLAVMAACDIELGPGFAVLTGETGAGKSILVDALGLVLGDRADLDQVRSGADQAEISATFELPPDSPARAILRDQALEGEEGECVIRRVLSREGRSKAFINGRPTPVQTLKDLGEWLVDIHGQGEHHTLLHTATQRDLLDAFAGSAEQAGWVAEAWRNWRSARERLEELERSQGEREERRELLRFQVSELEELDLRSGETEELETERNRLGSAHRLMEGAQGLIQLLYEEEGSVSDRLGHAQTELENLSETDPELAEARDLVANSTAQAEEAAEAVRHYLNRLEADPERLAAVQERLDTVYQLARKHHVEPEELVGLAERLRGELDELEELGPRLEAARKEVERTRGIYADAAAELTRMRGAGAEKLAERVTEEIQVLGMPDAALVVAVETADDPAEGGAHGMDRVEYRVRTNPGEPPRSLAKIASGGELSRLSLGIQVVLARHTEVPTLIFDEVDVGVSGAVAEMVGRKLRAVGERSQVLAVTHLPQVAAQGHHHLRIFKETDAEGAYTRVEPLAHEDRVEEIARILGSRNITDSTRANAREMLAEAEAAD